MRSKRIYFLLFSLSFVFACKTFESSLPKSVPTKPEEVTPEAEGTYELVDESPAPGKFTIVRVGQNDGKLADILRLEAQKALAMGRQPFVEFYADWCPPCNAIREYIGDTQMINAFDGTYVIKLGLDKWEKSLSGTGFHVVGIPAFYELDAEGKPTGRMITGGAWGEDVPENIAPPLKEFFNGGKSE